MKKYLDKGDNVIIACNRFQRQIIKNEGVDVEFVDIDGYNISLSSSKNSTLNILLQIPKILKSIKLEKIFVKNFIANNNVDIIISDNRYGFRNKNVKSVIITHQTYIKTPIKISFFELLLNRINTIIINKFTECWIPDIEGDGNISGDLSHKNNRIKRFKYIGIISRFNKPEKAEKTNKILAIISGPEPQRTEFENILVNTLLKLNYKSVVVRGTEKNIKTDFNNITFINTANSEQLLKLIAKSEYIISRSGYTSILDYVKLGISPILVPTPGQTEQEYLAEYLADKYGFISINQSQFFNKLGSFVKNNPS